MTQAELRYEFGKNWARYIEEKFSDSRVEQSAQQMLHFLRLPSLEGRSFLDIGCGSGLHSLAAWRARAASVASFDYDLDSVATTTKLHELADRPANWRVMQGSALDDAFLSTLPSCDVVYSWGVLHHTGAMWAAFEKAAKLLAPRGVFYVALYSKDNYVDPPAEYWLALKKKYNLAGQIKRRWMELAYVWRHNVWLDIRARRNPLTRIMQYEKSRGMSFLTDARDWLGGWPMEFAGMEETKARGRAAGLELLNVNGTEGCAEYLFRREGESNYWDDVRARLGSEPLEAPFVEAGGQAWRVALPHLQHLSDTVGHARRSRLVLFEDGSPLGLAHTPHALIQKHGGGRYAHWNESLFFSSTDGSNPNTNGRRYSVCADML